MTVMQVLNHSQTLKAFIDYSKVYSQILAYKKRPIQANLIHSCFLLNFQFAPIFFATPIFNHELQAFHRFIRYYRHDRFPL